MAALPDFSLQVLFHDDYILVVNKPAGLMVEPDRNGHPNLLYQVRHYLKDTVPAGAAVYAQHLHRLDRPVSGIVLFAIRREVLHILSNQFAERRVQKYYEALTTAAPAQREGTLAHWHRKEKKKAVISEQELPYSEAVRLDYTTQPHGIDHFLWDITLHTGKYHQIRAQLAYAGCPILGDSLYGSLTPYKPEAIALHAMRLGFTHPVTGEAMMIEQESPF